MKEICRPWVRSVLCEEDSKYKSIKAQDRKAFEKYSGVCVDRAVCAIRNMLETWPKGQYQREVRVNKIGQAVHFKES